MAKATETSCLDAKGVFDLKGKLLEANEAMYLFLGTTKEKKTPLYTITKPDFAHLPNNVEDGTTVFSGIITVSNFSEISFELNAEIIYYNGHFSITAKPDVMGMFEMNKNMSRINQQVNNLQRELIREKKKLETTLEKLKETQQMLIQSEKMNALGQMVAGVAHEINNPIAFVTNNLYELNKYTNEIFEAFTELGESYHSSGNNKASEQYNKIKEKYELQYLKEDVSAVLNESQTGVERVKKIVEDLRRFSRLDEAEIKHIDLIENIQSTLSIIRPQIVKKEIDFQIIAPEKLYTDCYPGQLNQALLNILINAIFAVEVKGKIVLTIKAVEKKIIIAIKDNGCGIPEDSMDKIFNPFYTTKPVGSGTGLGLSITYKIITDIHKGSIEAESEQNVGTTIRIILPQKKIN